MFLQWRLIFEGCWCETPGETEQRMGTRGCLVSARQQTNSCYWEH